MFSFVLQVMAKQFEVIRLMASSVPTFSRRDAYAAIVGLVEKVCACVCVCVCVVTCVRVCACCYMCACVL